MIKKLFVSFFTYCLLTSVGYAELNLELPNLNTPDFSTSTDGVIEGATGDSLAIYSPDQSLGLKILRDIRKHLPVIEDPELNSWIRNLGNKLARKAPRHGKFYFLLVKNPAVNAFATQGGVIVINTGLVLQADSESELAAVIAHEIAHVTQNHHSRLMAQSKGRTLSTGAAILAGIVAGSQNSEVGGAIITTALAAQEHNQLSFTRGMESEADRVGIRILSRAGFKAKGMPAFMAKLDRLNDNPNSQLTKYLRSHPLSIERLSDTRSRAQRLGNRGRDNINFFYAREKIRGLLHLSTQAETPPLPNAAITTYAQSIKLAIRGQHNSVIQKLGLSNKHLPEALAIAHSLNSLHQYQKTIQLLIPLAKIHAGEQAILVPLSNALLATNQANKAWQYLKQVVPTEQTSLSFFEVKQEVARRNGYLTDAYLAAADRNIRISEPHHATAQLKQAIKLPGISGQDIARLQSKLNTINKK